MKFGRKLAGILSGIAPDAVFVLGTGVILYAIALICMPLAIACGGVVLIVISRGMKRE